MMIGTQMPALCPAEPVLRDGEVGRLTVACDPAAFLALMSGCLAAPATEPVPPELRPAAGEPARSAAEGPQVASMHVALPAGVPAAPPALHPAQHHQAVPAPRMADVPAARAPLHPSVRSPVPANTAGVRSALALPQQAQGTEPPPRLSSPNTPVMPRIEAGPAGRAEPSTARPAAAQTGDAPRIPAEPVAAAPVERRSPVVMPTRTAAEAPPPAEAAPIAAPEPSVTLQQRPATIAPSSGQTGEPAPESAAPAVQIAGPEAMLQPGEAAVARRTVQAQRADEESAGEPPRPAQSVAGPPAAQAVAEAVQRPSRLSDPPPLPAAAEPAELKPPVLAEPPALQPERFNADEASLPPHEAQPTDPPRERSADQPAVESPERLPSSAPGPDVPPAPQHAETGGPTLVRGAQAPAVTIRGPLRLQPSEQRVDAPERLVVEVDPPELGRCELELSLHEGRLRAVLVAERPETVAALRSVEGQVREQLAARELQVAEFDVRQGAGQEQRHGAPGYDRQESVPRQTAHARMRLRSEAPLSRPPARRPSGTGLVDVVA
jgi:flagellar hook-length control protein FliK